MPRDRKYPHGAREFAALDSQRWASLFNAAQRVVVYWQTSADVVDIVGYYDSVSEANTAAQAAENAAGALPRVLVNWGHSSISHVSSGPIEHPDAREALPSWIDAEPIA